MTRTPSASAAARLTLALALASVAFPAPSARAQLFDTVDRSIAAGVSSAPTPVSVGRGDGAGGVIGEDSGAGRSTTFAFDSDVLGRVRLAIAGGGCTPAGAFGVIYIDSVAGGVLSTAALVDVDTPEEAAVSGGASLMPNVSVLTFGPGFDADFAVAFTNTVAGASATLYALTAAGQHTVVGTLVATQVAPGTCSRLEIRGITLSALGVAQGASFDWLATLLDGTTGFRTNEFQGVASPPASNPQAAPVTLGQGDFNRFDTVDRVLINEVDADTPGADTLEFVELFGAANTTLDGAVIVFFNGAGDTSYRTLDLDTHALNGAGYVFVANPGVAGAALTFANGTLQNGPDAVALYLAASFANGTTVTDAELVDALVYGNSAASTTLLLDTLTPSQAMIAEGASASEREAKSIQRCPNGAGSPRVTAAFQISSPSPGEANVCAYCGDGFVDADEQCDDGAGVNGSGTSCCAVNCRFRASGDVCTGTSLDVCDAEDTCDGAGLCVDNRVSAGTACRPVIGDCDVAEVCDGMSPSCPADAVRSGSVCRPAMGDCDVAEMCEGSSHDCPADGFALGTVCRPSTGECDPVEVCAGTAPDCPSDTFLMNGTLCGDSLACNGQDVCMSGVCAPGTALDCNDSNACTTDSCVEPDGCAHMGVADCCNVDGDCDDGDLCTADTCSGPGGTCGASPITDCCVSDVDCDDANLCTTETCNLTTNRCERGAVSNCCVSDADCGDANVCTADTCDVSSGTCSNVLDTDCCLTDGDCSDAETCTLDLCDPTLHTCSNALIAGCCTADGECDDGDDCTADSCSLATSMCVNAAVPGCGAPDGGVPLDGGAGDDGGVLDDGGVATDGGAADDAGSTDDAGGRDAGQRDGGRSDASVMSGGMSGGACAVRRVSDADDTSWAWAVLGLLAACRARRRRS